jgi:4-hydroxybenzoate polyprenyltransferase
MKPTRRTAWLELLRLPNVFTAAADVMMGYLVTHGTLQRVPHFVYLVLASCLLYLSGMVLNDVFDADVDTRDRPYRPIPSGRVSLRAATAAGWALLASGLLCAWFLSFQASDPRPGTIATLLALCVVLYDRILKRTPFAPLLMGACRLVNVLLGMSLVYLSKPMPGHEIPIRRPWLPSEWLIAIGVGTYFVGVTVFARTDARTSSRARLVTGFAIVLVGMGLLAGVPALTENPALVIGRNGWYLLWAALAVITARRCILAIAQPDPQRVQAAVRHCVQSIIVLDAAVCVGYAGPFWGFVVLAPLFPTIALTLWLDAT